MTRALLEQALEALESVAGKGKRCESAITAISAHLAQPQGEQLERKFDDPTDPGHDVETLRQQVRHLERRVQQLSAKSERKPMTPQQILDLIPDDNTENDIGEWIVLVVRGVEKFHDIKETT